MICTLVLLSSFAYLFIGAGKWLWNHIRLMRSVPRAPGGSFLVGHLVEILGPKAPFWHAAAERALGPIYRCRLAHMDIVVITDPAVFSSLVMKGPSYLPKSIEIYKSFELVLSSKSVNMVSAPDGPVQKAVRKAVLACFSMTNLKSVFPKVVAQCRRISSQLSADKSTDMAMAAKRLTIDVIGSFGYGEELGTTQDIFAPSPVFELVSGMILAMSEVFSDPLWPLKRWTKTVKKGMANCARYEKWLDDFVTRIMANPPPANSLLSALLSVRDPITQEPLSKERLMAEIGILLVAGYETTANALSFTLLQLLKQPAVLAKVQRELKELGIAAHDGQPGRDVEWEDLGKLTYLNAVIKETLRHSPPAALGSFRVTQTDTMLCGKLVPPGTTVMLSPLLVDRSIRNYGPDADEYRPERWLEAASANDGNGGSPPTCLKEPYVFSMGPRDCVGQSLARLEMQVYLATLLSRHALELDNTVHKSVEQVEEDDVMFSVVLQLKHLFLKCPPLV